MFMFKGKKRLLMVSALSLALAGGMGWFYFNQESVKKDVVLEDIDLSDFIPTFSLYNNKSQQSILVNGVDISNVSYVDKMQALQGALDAKRAEIISVSYGDRVFERTLDTLGLTFEDSLDVMLGDIEKLGDELKNSNLSRIRLPAIYTPSFTYDEALLTEWVNNIGWVLHIAPVEPGLTMSGSGNFNITESHDGRALVQEPLLASLRDELKDVNVSSLTAEASTEVIHPTRDRQALTSVNTRIAAASSSFAGSESGRAENIRRGAALVNGTVLMPGDEFSFNSMVYPVNAANGFHQGVAIMNNEFVPGIYGGGLCQLSSTIYWAQLRMGILATARRAHSRAVFYVPRGLDATMFIGQIDYRFKNTFDYPIYLNAFTSGSTLTIEFWSNENAQGGRTFEPVTRRVDTTATTKSYDTFLRTYNASGSLLFEYFIHRSTYRTD